MNSTALGAKKKKLVLLVKHMRNSTMKKSRKLGSRCISQGTLLLPWNKRGYTKKCG